MRLLLLLAACAAPEPTPGCEAGTAGWSTSRPLAVVGDRVSDRLELYSVDPLARVACRSLDEDANFVNEPFDLAAGADALYVVLGHAHNYRQGTLVKLRLSDGTKLGEVTLGEEPSMIALSGNRAWITLFRNLNNLSGPWTQPGAVVEVDTAAMKVTATSPDLCAAPLGVALDESRARLWVACAGGAQLALVDVSGPPVLERLVPLDDAGTVGNSPAYLVLDGKHAFVTAQASMDLWIFDQETAALVKRIAFESTAFPQRLALTPTAVLVALDASSALAAVDRQALVVSDRLPLGLLHPQGIAVHSHWALFTDEHDLVQPGHLARVELSGLGAGGAHLEASVPAAVFPQAVIVLP